MDQLPDDTLLLFRLGDFYELFEKDAETASILGITLTKRDMPMAGILSCGRQLHLQGSRCRAQGGYCGSSRDTQPGKLVKRALTAS